MGSSELHVKSRILPTYLQDMLEAIGTDMAKNAMGILGLDVFFHTRNEVWAFHLDTRRLCAINLNATTFEDWRVLCCGEEIEGIVAMLKSAIDSCRPVDFEKIAGHIDDDLIDAFICTCVNEYAEHVSIRGDVESRDAAVKGVAIRDLTSGDVLRYMLRFSDSCVFAPSSAPIAGTRAILDFSGAGYLQRREPIFRLQLNCDVVAGVEASVRMRELIEAEYVNGIVQENEIYGIVSEVRREAKRNRNDRRSSDPDRN